MLVLFLPIIPIAAMFLISTGMSYDLLDLGIFIWIKFTSLIASILNLFCSFIVFISYNNSSNQFQFVQECYQISPFDFYLGIDGLSVYFMLLTTIIIPISLLSNWISISNNIRSHVIIILLLEILLLLVFLVVDILLYYIFFESILPPLFILIGLFGSSEKVRASFFLFLYTLLGSLFLLLSIVTMSSTMGTTDFDLQSKTNYDYFSQLFLFYGIFIAFAVKTPTIFLNTWLLKAHVESPLGGSIILAGIVLKLSLYGIFRLIIPLLPKACLQYTFIVYLIGVITIIYASISTLRTIDVKELIAYSSVSHAAVYLLGVFSNTIQGIEGGIILGLAHGFVSSGLFICVGGVLYDRSITRTITYYRGIAQLMPLFSILFFILCLANAGTPFTLNFIGEFLSLYGTFERLPLLGAFASSSIVFSAAYTIYMFNRIAFAGSFTKSFLVNIPDVNKREFFLLLTLVVFTVVLGVYPAPILDGLHYTVSSLINKAPDLYLIFFFVVFSKTKNNNEFRSSSPINNDNSKITNTNGFPPKKPNKFRVFIKKLISQIFTLKFLGLWIVTFSIGLLCRFLFKTWFPFFILLFGTFGTFGYFDLAWLKPLVLAWTSWPKIIALFQDNHLIMMKGDKADNPLIMMKGDRSDNIGSRRPVGQGQSQQTSQPQQGQSRRPVGQGQSRRPVGQGQSQQTSQPQQGQSQPQVGQSQPQVGQSQPQVGQSQPQVQQPRRTPSLTSRLGPTPRRPAPTGSILGPLPRATQPIPTQPGLALPRRNVPSVPSLLNSQEGQSRFPSQPQQGQSQQTSQPQQGQSQLPSQSQQTHNPLSVQHLLNPQVGQSQLPSQSQQTHNPLSVQHLLNPQVGQSQLPSQPQQGQSQQTSQPQQGQSQLPSQSQQGYNLPSVQHLLNPQVGQAQLPSLPQQGQSASVLGMLGLHPSYNPWLAEDSGVFFEKNGCIDYIAIKDDNDQIHNGYSPRNTPGATNQPAATDIAIVLERIKSITAKGKAKLTPGMVSEDVKNFLTAFINDHPSIPNRKLFEGGELYQTITHELIKELRNAN